MRKRFLPALCALALLLACACRAEGIELNKTAATVKVSKTLQLYCRTADTHETPEVAWKSSNPYVASVNEKGKVSAKAAGDAVITATAQSGESAACAVHVPGNPVAQIRFPAEEIRLGLGKTQAFAAGVNKDASQKRVSYASSDESVVKIDKNGKLRGVSMGEATVRATAANGLTAYARVRVVVALERVAFSQKNLTLYLGGAAAAPGVVFSPENTGQTRLLWKSYDESVVTVDENGVISPVAQGVTKVALKGENGQIVELPVRVVVGVESLSMQETRAARRFEKFALSVSARPAEATDASVTWTSDNPDVACVLPDGTVYALTEGVARICAAANGGENVRAVCEVTVKENPDITPKPLALTFDDGPAPNTLKLLEVLKAYNARATFFMVGKNVERRPDVARAVADAGHEVGSHSYNHDNILSPSVQAARKNLQRADEAFEKVLGEKPGIIRAPGGDITVKRAGYLFDGRYFIHWTGNTSDWQCLNARTVHKRTLSLAKAGGIMLYHDLYASTTDAMKTAVPALIEKGYYFVTISELLALYPPEAGDMIYYGVNGSK